MFGKTINCFNSYFDWKFSIDFYKIARNTADFDKLTIALTSAKSVRQPLFHCFFAQNIFHGISLAIIFCQQQITQRNRFALSKNFTQVPHAQTQLCLTAGKYKIYGTLLNIWCFNAQYSPQSLDRVHNFA